MRQLKQNPDLFPIRQDRYGQRIVYLIGNENKGGKCPFQCKGCNANISPKVTPESNMRRLRELHGGYEEKITGQYHALIYNGGNITNPSECSREALDDFLNFFREDERVAAVSISSRGKFLTDEMLGHIGRKYLPYQVNIIFGQESFSPLLKEIYGKDTMRNGRVSGELEEIAEKITEANSGYAGRVHQRFGLEVNLLYLAELYPDKKSREGIEADVKTLLKIVDKRMLLEIDINPFYEVPQLPYKSADVEELLGSIPRIQGIIREYNQNLTENLATIFIGILSPDGTIDERLRGISKEVEVLNNNIWGDKK